MHLARRDDEYVIPVNGKTLMSSRMLGWEGGIRATVLAHREDRFYLEGPYQVQVNGEIQAYYAERGRYDELAEPKYTDPGAIFEDFRSEPFGQLRVNDQVGI